MFEQISTSGQQAEVGLVNQENRLRLIGPRRPRLDDRLLQRCLIKTESDHQDHKTLLRIRPPGDKRRKTRHNRRFTGCGERRCRGSLCRPIVPSACRPLWQCGVVR